MKKETLIKMRNVINQRGWRKGARYDNRTNMEGRVCLLGAWDVAEGKFHDDYQELANVIGPIQDALYPELRLGTNTVTMFNDHDQVDEVDVMSVLQAAIDAAEQELITMAELTKPIIGKVLSVFGSNGEHWIKGKYDDAKGNFCLVGAFRHVDPIDGDALAKEILPAIKSLYPEHETMSDVPSFNDNDAIDFIDVKNVLLGAYEKAPA